MNKYIPAEKLIAEIESIINRDDPIEYNLMEKQAYNRALSDAIDIISSLQQEQPELPSNLDEAAVEFSKDVASGHIYKDLCVGFKAGAEWQKEQVLKDAVDGKVYFQIGGIKRVKSDDFENSGIHLGDKVRIIIVKEE
jgi:hypothetical protein